jgi:hypothetical protein
MKLNTNTSNTVGFVDGRVAVEYPDTVLSFGIMRPRIS